MSELYRRTPRPKRAGTPVLVRILLWMGLIFSPFVAFTVNGRVDDSNWTPAVLTALMCLAGLLLIRVRDALSYAEVPAAIRAEYEKGRLMRPLSTGSTDKAPIDFGPNGPQAPLAGATPKGVWFAPDALCGASWRRSRDMLDTNLKAGLAGGSKLPAHFLDWSELAEWQVCDGSDGPDYYRLVLCDGAHVDLKRPANPAEEPPLLDYVRTVGGRAVRLFCDVA